MHISHLTSNLYKSPKRYLEIYQNNLKSIPVVLSIKKKDLPKKEDIKIEIPWEEVEITRVDDKKFGNLFQIDLKKIKIKEN